MQLMSWVMARLGSRFSLLFEPYQRRVMHSALGRFLDAPLDLMVGLVEPDGTERVLPFTTRGETLFNCEQFERINSITYRGFSEKYNLRFEFNVHGVFYPQDEAMCILPAFYLEMRVSPMARVRWSTPKGETPEKVKLFIRLARPETSITTCAADGGSGARIDLAYSNSLKPQSPRTDTTRPMPDPGRHVMVRERIVSLTPGAEPDAEGRGLTIELPVTEPGSGTKWRLVWGAHCGDPVLDFVRGDQQRPARLRYVRRWKDIDAVIAAAVSERDGHLMHSRRLEKLLDQATLQPAQRHLLHQGFQAFLGNTFWCDVEGGLADWGTAPIEDADDGEWFSVWEGSCFYHSTVDVEYNVSLVYLTLWPRLLAMQLNQWPSHVKDHGPSGGGILAHDVGKASVVGRTFYDHDMPVEENCNYLLMAHAHAHWSGDESILHRHGATVQKLALYLLWTDRDGSGFPSEGVANTIDDASPAVQFARKQTYLAVKRVAALHAAADLLRRAGQPDLAQRCSTTAETDAGRIDREAWLGDHYAVCVDRSAGGLADAWTGKPLPYTDMPGWDAYSIYTGSGLLLPLMTGLPCPLDRDRLKMDLTNAARESLGRYGCGHTSLEPENVWISQNIWRDHLGRYLGWRVAMFSQHYWDMQVMSNTHAQSLGFVDTYIHNNLCFYPRGMAAMGYIIAAPRLTLDRLAADGAAITVEPDTHYPQRLPLLPLADWKANKLPICVVNAAGEVTIEGQIDPITIRSGREASSQTIG